MKDTQKIIRESLEHVAITARMAIETEEMTKDEAFEYIAEQGRRSMDKIMGMSDARFAEHVLFKMLDKLAVMRSDENGGE